MPQSFSNGTRGNGSGHGGGFAGATAKAMCSVAPSCTRSVCERTVTSTMKAIGEDAIKDGVRH